MNILYNLLCVADGARIVDILAKYITIIYVMEVMIMAYNERRQSFISELCTVNVL